MLINNLKFHFKHELFGKMGTRVSKRDEDGTEKERERVFIPRAVEVEKGLFASHSTTAICVDTRTNKEISRGVSLCSTKSQFCKEVGRKRALTRCLSNILKEKESRKSVWKMYFSRLSEEKRPDVEKKTKKQRKKEELISDAILEKL